MNRKIWFRGQTVDTGEWVEGYFVKIGDICFIHPGKVGEESRQVKPETVGQWFQGGGFPGLFDGDLIWWIDEDGEVIESVMTFEPSDEDESCFIGGFAVFNRGVVSSIAEELGIVSYDIGDVCEDYPWDGSPMWVGTIFDQTDDESREYDPLDEPAVCEGCGRDINGDGSGNCPLCCPLEYTPGTEECDFCSYSEECAAGG